jgi:3,4-dihydroxy 2-butanone 4-phosphate synthase/GTP cyclohydrolase II
MQEIAKLGRGVVVIIRQEENNKALIELVHHYQMQDRGVNLPFNSESPENWRTIGIGSRILADLGIHKLKLLGSQKKYIGLGGFDLELVEYAPLKPIKYTLLELNESANNV